MRALVADDDRVTTVVLGRALEKLGVEVVVARDGLEAWALLQGGGITIAILDLMRPGADGPEICRRIRAHDSLSHIYVLVVTARDARANLVAGLDAGADDYLIKPFDAEELRARIQVGLRVLTLQERLAARVAELRTALSTVKERHGLLPICSYCKSVRNGQDYWEQVEQYVSDHTNVQFSHGICPSCYETVVARWTASDSLNVAKP
jgi:sigma-B regulation protein RsbU (phosphoserine phosphatase)